MYQIVIVDDEPRICEGLVHLFPWESLGFHVAGSFTNGRDALAFVNEHPGVDVVMTDIEMPVMNGIELSRQLRDQRIAVVFFSAYQDFEYARSAIINHVVDYLVKPMSYDAISGCMKRLKAALDTDRRPPEASVQPDERPAFDLEAFVKRYIEKNYRTASLEEAAALAHYSVAYLSTAFKQAAGMNFSDWLTRVRMQKSLALIRNPKNKLYWIAEAVGYQNPKNLTRNFKDYYGITPQELRAGKPLLLHAEDAGDQP